MASGAYVALSGLRSRVEHLDRLAVDIANVETAGYKSDRVTHAVATRADFANVLQSAVDVAAAPGHIDFRPGVLVPTNYELDMALDGKGFFVVDTPGGARYTRTGQFTRDAAGTLRTQDGFAVMGENGPITLGAGQVQVQNDGTVRVDNTVVGRLRIVDFADYSVLRRESATRFTSAVAPQERPVGTIVRGGATEQSNVTMSDRVTQLTEVARGFEGLQRGLTILMNDVYGRAITELGRR